MGSLPPPPPLDLRASLFLDLDGTLVDFAPTPDAIKVGDDLRDLLVALAHKLDGRLAVISGRALANLTGHLGLPDLPAAGSHGLERRAASGASISAGPTDVMRAAIDEALAFAEREGLVAEAKPTGVAVHFRSRPEAGPAVENALKALAERHRLTLQPGAMVCELRLPGPDKGDVLRRFMAEPPFASGSPVMVGDDLTDEAAFAAAHGAGGMAVLVGPARATKAQFSLPSVAAVHGWLREAL